jgi:hypothetical protein
VEVATRIQWVEEVIETTPSIVGLALSASLPIAAVPMAENVS